MSRRRAGFSLLELVVALAVTALVFVNVGLVMQTSSSAAGEGSLAGELDVQMDQTLDRVGLALMSASLSSLDPTASAPAFHSSLEYVQSLGVQNGKVVVSDPERIELVIDDGKLLWRQRPGQLDERTVVWSRWVASFLEGEIVNGKDDNGNGLVDETGLAFVVHDGNVEIFLTLERLADGGKPVRITRSATVACRN